MEEDRDWVTTGPPRWIPGWNLVALFAHDVGAGTIRRKTCVREPGIVRGGRIHRVVRDVPVELSSLVLDAEQLALVPRRRELPKQRRLESRVRLRIRERLVADHRSSPILVPHL